MTESNNTTTLAEAGIDEAAEQVDEMTFADLGLSKDVLAAVADMGYTTPTPVQAAAIPQALAGRDVLAAAQTGTGKTAAFLLPTINGLPHVPRSRGRGRNEAQGPLMLVVTPTRELAQQIEEVCRAICRRTGHTSVTVVGGVSYNPQRDKLRRGCDILIATPGRLQDLIDQGACRLDQVQVLVLDEADRMLDMGFLPAVRRIVSYTREDRQTMLFSATLDDSQVGSITDLVHDPARVEIAPVTSTADTVEQYVLPVSAEAKNSLLTQVLTREGASRVIVFTRTKHRADTCARRLARAGFTTAAIHGDRSQAQRERALKEFRAGTCDLLVATDVLARGIDISDVRYVINFDVPSEPVDYIHRIGRTGRAGEEGWSVTFVTPDDLAEFFDIEALMGKTADIFDAEGLDVGFHPPVVDPDRVPAKAPAGKKEKKRRRKASSRGKSRGEGREAASLPREHRSTGDTRSDVAAAVTAVSQKLGEDTASKPSRRKRGGKTRVREDRDERASRDARDVRDARETRENRDDRDSRDNRPERADRSRDNRRGARSDRDDRRSDRRFDRAGRGGRERRSDEREQEFRAERGGRERRADRSYGRDDRRQHNRDDRRSSRGNVDSYETSSSREAWRNYDEPSPRRGRGGNYRDGQTHTGSRGGRAGGRDNRGGYGSRGGFGGGNGSNPAARRSTRRPGDRGGRR